LKKYRAIISRSVMHPACAAYYCKLTRRKPEALRYEFIHFPKQVRDFVSLNKIHSLVSAILLAAGESKRMGDTDKRFLLYKGKPLVNHVMLNLWHSKQSQLVIVMENNDNNLLNGQENEQIKVVVNPDYQRGMTTSIQVGVAAASENATGYMICLADQPLITSEDYNLIIKAFENTYLLNEKCIIVPFFDQKKGNPVIFSAHYREVILTHKNMEGCKEIIQANKEHIVTIDMPNDHILRDVDTPEDYERLETRE